jgi:hypothetical protein
MKLLRYGSVGSERPGILDNTGVVRDLSSVVDDIDGVAISRMRLERLHALDLQSLPIVSDHERLGACVSRPGKFVCIGLNYADHAAETGAAAPTEPVVFLKATSAVSGPNDDIIKPRGSTKLDWEVELALVIGSECRYVDEQTAQSAIAIELFTWRRATFHLDRVPHNVTGAFLLADASKKSLKVTKSASGVDIELPSQATDPNATVLVLETT